MGRRREIFALAVRANHQCALLMIANAICILRSTRNLHREAAADNVKVGRAVTPMGNASGLQSSGAGKLRKLHRAVPRLDFICREWHAPCNSFPQDVGGRRREYARRRKTFKEEHSCSSFGTVSWPNPEMQASWPPRSRMPRPPVNFRSSAF